MLLVQAETIYKISILDRPTIEAIMDKDEIPGWVQYPMYEKVPTRQCPRNTVHCRPHCHQLLAHCQSALPLSP